MLTLLKVSSFKLNLTDRQREFAILQFYLSEYSYQPYELYGRGEDRAGQPKSTSSTTVLCPLDEDRTATEGITLLDENGLPQ